MSDWNAHICKFRNKKNLILRKIIENCFTAVQKLWKKNEKKSTLFNNLATKFFFFGFILLTRFPHVILF